MDPNANLREQREIAARILSGEIDGTTVSDRVAIQRLAELVQALDQWLVNGGAVPADWLR